MVVFGEKQTENVIIVKRKYLVAAFLCTFMQVCSSSRPRTQEKQILRNQDK